MTVQGVLGHGDSEWYQWGFIIKEQSEIKYVRGKPNYFACKEVQGSPVYGRTFHLKGDFKKPTYSKEKNYNYLDYQFLMVDKWKISYILSTFSWF